jgi:MFS family permease
MTDVRRSPQEEMKLLPGAWPAALRSLRHRNYRLFLGGQLVSLVGTWLQAVAQSWLVYRLTGSSLLLGIVSFCNQAPVLFLAAIAGVAADRLPRREVIVGTQTAAMILAFALGVPTLRGSVTVHLILVLAALLGLVNAVDIPVRQAFVVEMVGRDDLANAIALNSSVVNGARFLGPALAGVMVSTMGEGWCFVLNGLSYVAVIVGLLRIELPARRPHATTSPLGDLAEGLRYVVRTGPIRSLLLLLGLVSLTAVPLGVLMPVFAASVLGGGAKTLGLLMGATGLGALAAAISLAARTTVRGLGRWVAASTGTLALFLVFFSASRLPWLSTLLVFVVGFAMMFQMAACNTLIQHLCPDVLRGRVMGVYSMVFVGLAPFGALVAGAVADRVGAPTTVALGGSLTALGAAAFALQLPRMRSQARALIARQELVEAQAQLHP